MKTFLSLWAVAYACVAMAEAPIVTTFVTAPGITNFVDIPAGQAAKVACLPGSHSPGLPKGYALVEKDGLVVAMGFQDVVAGPARFRISADSSTTVGLVTLERWPLVDPEKVLALPQGSNAVAVSMQTSTNLANWTPATNGVYRTTDGPKFFRLKAEK